MMEEFVMNIFNLALLPFSAHTYLVWIPGGFAFIYGCVSLLFRIMKGRF